MASQISKHLHTGRMGEDNVAAFLLGKAYTILRQNYRHRHAEVDIIAQQGDLLVFVEVKTRSTDRYGFPEEAVGTKKEAMLLSAAEEFILQEGWGHEVQFDIISVTLPSPLVIHHIEDAFH